MDLRQSRRVFGVSALVGYLAILTLLVFLRAPLEVLIVFTILLAISTFGILRGWPPRPPHPRSGRKRTWRAGALMATVIVLLSVLGAFNWRGSPPGFLPNAEVIILSGIAVAFIVIVAARSASQPWRVCPECGGRLPVHARMTKCPYCGHSLSEKGESLPPR